MRGSTFDIQMICTSKVYQNGHAIIIKHYIARLDITMCDSSCVHVSKDLAKAKSYDSDLVFAQILLFYSLLKSLFVERSDESPLLHYVVKIFDRSQEEFLVLLQILVVMIHSSVKCMNNIYLSIDEVFVNGLNLDGGQVMTCID